jgi:hypothetical protein
MDGLMCWGGIGEESKLIVSLLRDASLKLLLRASDVVDFVVAGTAVGVDGEISAFCFMLSCFWGGAVATLAASTVAGGSPTLRSGEETCADDHGCAIMKHTVKPITRTIRRTVREAAVDAKKEAEAGAVDGDAKAFIMKVSWLGCGLSVALVDRRFMP